MGSTDAGAPKGDWSTDSATPRKKRILRR